MKSFAKIDVLANAFEASRRAAAFIAGLAREAIDYQDRFVMALSGGNTPVQMFRELAAETVPWSNVHVLQVNERVASLGGPDRNLTLLYDSLVARIPQTSVHVHPMPVEDFAYPAWTRWRATLGRGESTQLTRRFRMHLGMIGLGRMGASLVQRLVKRGHKCVVYDVSPAAVKKIVGRGVRGCASVEELVAKLPTPRAVWVMVPAGVTGGTVEELASHMDAGDIIIDGGNSYYRDTVLRAKALDRMGIRYVDCGTSGGVFGLERGFCLMIGGEDQVVRHLDPIFKSIAPGVKAALRTPGKKGTPGPAEHGYLHCGPSGAGHFVKMVHNGIEYGLMAAYAEGLNILHNADAGKRLGDTDAETAPVPNSNYYQYELDLPEIAEVWRRGSVIASWLLDLTAASLQNSPDLKNFGGRVSDSGEGRWTIEAAIDEAVPAPVLTAALYERFSSRGGADFANRVLSAMRKQFGGHDEKKRGSR